MKKAISILLCFAMLLSLAGMPVLADDPTANLPDSTIIYEKSGAISVGCEYSVWNNYWVKFTTKGVNKLMQIYALYIDSKSATKPTNCINSSISDWVGPIAFCVDDSEDSTVTWTGGAHGWDDNKTSSAYTESVTLKVDGALIEKPTDTNLTLTGKVAEITVVNLIKAGNDRDGDYSLKETVVYTVSSNTIDVHTTLTALEDLKIHTYYGLQSINQPYELVSYRNGDPTPALTPGGYTTHASGPRSQYPDVDQAVHKTANGDVLEVNLDRTYGIGTFEYNRKPSTDAANTSKYNKTYFYQVVANNADDALALKTGESAEWKGNYRFYKEAPTTGAIEECEELYFDNFSTDTNLNKLVPDSTVVTKDDAYQTALSVTADDYLKVGKPGYGYGFTYFEIPADVLNSNSKDANQFVIETNSSIQVETNDVFINRTRIYATYGNRNNEDRCVSGNYYIVYDSENNSATYIFPDGSTEFKTGLPASSNGFSVGFMGANSFQKVTSHDYIAVYTYANKFKGKVEYTNPTTAVLHTNMPIEAENNQLKVGDITATVSKVADTYNTYSLTFSEALPKGILKLTGNVLKITCGEKEDISVEFDTRNTKCEELYFDDFSTDANLSKLVPDSTVVTKDDAYQTTLSVTADGYLKVGKPGYGYGFTYFEIPADVLNSNFKDADQFVIETKSSIQGETNDAFINRTRIYATYGNRNNEDRCVSGNYYILYNSADNSARFIFPDGSSEVKTGIPASSNGFSAGFMGTNNAQKITSHDYIAVYTYADSFEGRLEDITETTATLYTNLPISENSSLKVGDIAATVTKKANSYNTYELTFAKSLPGGNLALTGKVLKLLDNAEEEISISFKGKTVQEHNLAFYPFDERTDISKWSNKTATVTKEKLDTGEDVLRFRVFDDNGAAVTSRISVPSLTNPYAESGNPRANLPKLAYEVRIKTNYLSSNAYITPRAMYSYETQSFGIGGYLNKNKLKPSSGQALNLATVSQNEWHTITVLYNNEQKGEYEVTASNGQVTVQPTSDREIYLDGEYVGTVEAGNRQNGWVQFGTFSNTIQVHYNNSQAVEGKENDRFEIDHIKCYVPIDAFEVLPQATATPDSIILDFNQSLGKLEPSWFSVNGKTASKVEIYDEETNKYKVIFSELLDGNTSYSLTIDGATDVLGNKISDKIDFTTSGTTTQVTATTSAFVGSADSTDAYTAYTFGKFFTNDKALKFKECGAVISATDASPEIGKDACRKFKVLVPVMNNGCFGIGIKDKDNKILGSSYYMRTYVIYEKDGAEVIYYGAPVKAQF